MATRNDVRVIYKGHDDPRTAMIPEGSMRQQLDAYEALPPAVRLALRNARYDHSPYQLLRTARIRGYDEDQMLLAVQRADEKKRSALIRTGCPIPDAG